MASAATWVATSTIVSATAPSYSHMYGRAGQLLAVSSIGVKCELAVSNADLDIAIVKPNYGGWWCLQHLPGGVSGLEQELLLFLHRAGIPSPSRNDILRPIFRNILISPPGIKQVVIVYLQTKVVPEPTVMVLSSDDEDEESSSGDEDEDEEMEEGSLMVMSAKREAIEALNKVRIMGGERESSCVICLEEFNLGMEATKMPCQHLFHQECILKWLEGHCFCPLCRFKLPSSSEEAP